MILLLGTSVLALAGCVSNAARERADAAYQASTARIAVLAPKPRAARVSAPNIGTRLKWSCTGPYTRNYDVAVAGIDSGLVKYTGNIVYAGSDGTAYPYEIEKHWTLTGTGLWSSQAGDKRQWFDYEYFRDFAKLKPGSVFRGPVPARSGNSLWVSDFEIAVGKSQRINHGVLGRITVIPITEKRKIFHKDYAATLVTLLEPKRGISVSWTYTDKEGKEECDLVHYGDKRGTAS
ncbi:MAG: hypothetical protein QNJ91_13785 [Gammaproteobacteria bacterium]|nr:hypothetical protein [Gammaproteobacteria bacterium]